MTTKKQALAAIGAIALSAGLVSPAIGWDSGKVSSQAVTSSATKALDWLETQFAANGHHLKSGFVSNGQFQTFDDPGLTIDGLLALAAGGRTADAEAIEGANWMQNNTSEYVTGFDPESLYAGAVGKAMVFSIIYDIDYTNIDGRNLEADLRGRLQQSGRFTDDATDFESGDPVDYSNGIGQAFGVLALAATTNGAPESAVTYLLKQQCPNGGFRSELADTQCADNAKVDVDATSFALTALGVLEDDAHDDDIVDGLIRLQADQKENGSFEDNANSTGLAGVTIRGYGGHPPANEAAAFVKSLQLTTGANAGAILLDEEGYDAAVANGLDEQGRTIAARATSQAVLTLGLPAYPLIGEREPVEPATTIALSTASLNEGATLTVTGGGFYSTEKVKVVVTSDPVTVGEPVANASGIISQSFALPPSVKAGAHTVTLTGEASGVVISAPFTVVGQAATTTTTAAAGGTTSTTVRSAIVRTGANSTDNQVMVAGALLVVGGALMLSTRRRRIIYPFKK